MKILEFDIRKGLYEFRSGNVETGFHQHPAMEILYAQQGSFTVETGRRKYPAQVFAVIERNTKHRLAATGCDLTILMIEHHNLQIIKMLNDHGIVFSDGCYGCQSTDACGFSMSGLIEQIKTTPFVSEYDRRISDVMAWIEQHDLEYRSAAEVLSSVAHLSQSRLSHLFKDSLGISLKKYLVWSKLRKTIQHYLSEKEDLFSSLIRNGFYDQPHFSKAFTSMLGISPAKAYNSRTVQVLPDANL